MKFKDISAILGTWVSIVAAIVGGFLALEAWNEAAARRVDERVAYSFRMAEELHRPEMVRIRAAMREATPSTRANAPMRVVCSENPTTTLSDPEIYTLVAYFERAKMCVDTGLCSADHLQTLIGPFALGLQEQLAFHLTQQRKRDTNYGAGITMFAGTPPPEREEVERQCTLATMQNINQISIQHSLSVP